MLQYGLDYGIAKAEDIKTPEADTGLTYILSLSEDDKRMLLELLNEGKITQQGKSDI